MSFSNKLKVKVNQSPLFSRPYTKHTYNNEYDETESFVAEEEEEDNSFVIGGDGRRQQERREFADGGRGCDAVDFGRGFMDAAGSEGGLKEDGRFVDAGSNLGRDKGSGRRSNVGSGRSVDAGRGKTLDRGSLRKRQEAEADYANGLINFQVS